MTWFRRIQKLIKIKVFSVMKAGVRGHEKCCVFHYNRLNRPEFGVSDCEGSFILK